MIEQRKQREWLLGQYSGCEKEGEYPSVTLTIFPSKARTYNEAKLKIAPFAPNGKAFSRELLRLSGFERCCYGTVSRGHTFSISISGGIGDTFEFIDHLIKAKLLKAKDFKTSSELKNKLVFKALGPK